jgi:putative DNA primase/helicase
VNTGPAWKSDECLQRFDAARRVCRAASSDADSAAEKKRLSKAATTAAVLQFAQSDLRMIVPADRWDADRFVLNTPAGVVDLRSGVLRPRGDELHTLCAGVSPDMRAAAPTFARFIEEVFVGDRDLIDFVQRVLGYYLTGDRREQKLLFWHGAGSNGKSTLLDLVQRILGTYAKKIAGDTLMTSRSGNEKHATGVAQLRGIRLACSSELEEGAFFNEPLLKELTGDATVSARFMRGDFFEFEQTQKHVVVGNFKPRLRGGDPAMARRIVLVPFKARFSEKSRDDQMPAKLWAEAPAILAWMVRGALAWQERGLRIPERVLAEGADYMALHDDLQLWREERCTADPSGKARSSELYGDFKRWKEARGEHALAATAWAQRLDSQPGITKFRSSGSWYRGISLRPVAAFGVGH